MKSYSQLAQSCFWSFGIAVVLSLGSLAIMWMVRGFDATFDYVGGYFVLQLGLVSLLLFPVVSRRRRSPGH